MAFELLGAQATALSQRVSNEPLGLKLSETLEAILLSRGRQIVAERELGTSTVLAS